MSNNQETRVDAPINLVEGPLIGRNLMKAFKDQLILQKVFREMFGDSGERIFFHQMPNINETIVPVLVMRWGSDKFKSIDTYFEGTIDCAIGLPARVDGDVNALRQVGNMFERFMGGPMKMFDPTINPGLIKFGVDTEFKYGGIFNLSGIQLPAIEFTIPFVFDMVRVGIDDPNFDFFADLDAANLPNTEEYDVTIQPTDPSLVVVSPSIDQGVAIVTGQTN